MVTELAFGAALIEVAKVLATKAIIDPALEKGLEQFNKWLTGPYDEASANQNLRITIDNALDEIRKDTPDAFDRLNLVKWMTGKSPDAHKIMAAAAVEMVRLDPRKVPDQLMLDLGLDVKDDQRRLLLARFLVYLREQLADKSHFSELINYANDLESHDLLSGLGLEVANIALDTRRIKTLTEQLVAHFGITDDDAGALEKYLTSCREQWSRLALPLVRKNVGRFSPEIKRIFVPLMARDDQEEEKIRKEQEKRRVKNRLGDQRDEQLISVDFYAAFAKYPNFVLVGMPGSGKTTLLRRAALAFAENRPEDIGWQGAPKIPVFVRLRNFGIYMVENHAKFPTPGPGVLVTYLEENMRNVEKINIPNDFFEKRLQAGKCVILLDGLDEVLENRVDVAQSINAFITKYGHCGNRIGLSSRPRGYEGDVALQLSRANLPLLEVLPLQPPGIRDLIRKVLPLLEENAAKQQEDFQRLSSRILSRQSLTEIASVPLFCASLVQVYKYNGADLPQRRVDVLAEVADLLLGFWYAQATDILNPDKLAKADGTDTDFEETKDAVETKFNRLAHLAYKMQAELGLVEIETEEAARILSRFLVEHEDVPQDKAHDWAERFLRSAHLQSGLFVESSPGIHAFLHKNFLEYFAASSLVLDEDNPIAVIKDHLDDTDWEEILRLAAAHPKASNVFRNKLIPEIIQCAEACEVGSEGWKRRLWMAGQMANDMTGRLPGAPKKQISETLHQAAINDQIRPSFRADLADALDQFWEPDDLHKFILIPSDRGAPFMIGRYPVTNAQYERFLQKENFDNQQLWINLPKFSELKKKTGQVKRRGDWSNEGWDWLQDALKDNVNLVLDGILYPCYWRDARFGLSRPHAPVVGISWWEANAYCRWLLAHWDELPEGRRGLPKPTEIRLPSEPEWVMAAGGEQDGRFAWGKLEIYESIIRFANTENSSIGRTTSVWIYQRGESQPHHLMDLSGNVFEWQANYLNFMNGSLALRGGSWSDYKGFARVANRYSSTSNFRVNNYGFRVAGVFAPPAHPDEIGW